MLEVEKLQKIINEYIDNQDFTGTPSELYAPIEYILRQGGKSTNVCFELKKRRS